MKNEGPFLLEWLGFHRSIGFEDFLIFTNDCEDGSDKMADRLAELGVIEHVKNEGFEKKGPQWTALNSPPLRRALRKADWAIHLDLDEFVNIKIGTGQLTDLIDKIDGADAISIPWRFFGNADISRFVDAPILSQFTRCGPYPIMFPRQALMFKTLFRPSDILDKAGVHAPRFTKGKNLSDVKWVNGDGRQVTGTFEPKRPVMHGSNLGNSLAQINHYALRSIDSFTSYYVRRNFNDINDLSLSNRVWNDDLLEDTALQKLHHEACVWHKEAAIKVKSSIEGVDLYSAISVAGNTRVPPTQEVAEIYNSLGSVFGGAK